MQNRQSRHLLRPSARRRGLTLSETLIAAVLLALGLAVLARGMDGLRAELKRRQAVALMRMLDRALSAYHEETRRWPLPAPAMQPAATKPADLLSLLSPPAEREPDSGDRVMAALAQVPASRGMLRRVPDILRVPPDPDPQRQPWRGSEWGSVRDPWGRRLACLTAASESPAHRKAVAANGDRPIFISAGMDGRFGLTEAAAASDNIRSDEPR